MLNILKGPYLQWPMQNSITIMWETSGMSTSTVTYRATRKVHAGLDDPKEAMYLRAECLGEGNRSAWTQPFWIV